MEQILFFLHLDEMIRSTKALSWKVENWNAQASMSLVSVPSISITTDHFPVFSTLLGCLKANLEYGLHEDFSALLLLVKFSQRRECPRGKSVYLFFCLPPFKMVAGKKPSSIKVTASVRCDNPL